MRKPTQERKSELELKEELEKLVNSDIEDMSRLTKEVKYMFPGRGQNFMDYDAIKEVSDDRAKEIVDSIAEFYLNREIIKEISYIQQKNVVDKITVSNLLFQMKTAEYAIIKLLEEIDNGSVQPRTFEVLSSLQKSKMEIVKHLAQFMVIMENNYKSLREDYRYKKSEEPLELGMAEEVENEEVSTFQMRGGKQLIEALRNVIPEKKANEREDLEHEED
jgi:hypothetical protein